MRGDKLIICDKCKEEIASHDLTRVAGGVDLCRLCYKLLGPIVKAWVKGEIYTTKSGTVFNQ